MFENILKHTMGVLFGAQYTQQRGQVATCPSPKLSAPLCLIATVPMPRVCRVALKFLLLVLLVILLLVAPPTVP